MRQSKHLAHGGAMCNMDGGFLLRRIGVQPNIVVPCVIWIYVSYSIEWGYSQVILNFIMLVVLVIYTFFAGGFPALHKYPYLKVPLTPFIKCIIPHFNHIIIKDQWPLLYESFLLQGLAG